HRQAGRRAGHFASRANLSKSRRVGNGRSRVSADRRESLLQKKKRRRDCGRDGARTDGSMGLGRVELPTSRLSGVRSNHLSYRPGGVLGTIRKFEAENVQKKDIRIFGRVGANSNNTLRKEVIQPQVLLRLPC